ncbi:MAG: class I SAM-dependent methyltransferase [Ignavibacteria bacterium]|nr:class I SAM-dependent methyltransferase [Ignavibacteria bacterium]
MEVENDIQREYDPAHTNYERWKKARNLSDDRAKFVESVLSSEIIAERLKILDIGAGEGSTSKFLSQKNLAVSLEPKSERIKKIPKTDSLQPIKANSSGLPFKSSVFDIIILQDVIEHLNITEKLISDFGNLLKENGIIYLSTPNRLSLFNIISDPHWGMPLLCLFTREQIKKYFLKYFRRNDYTRDDIAELLSLKDLINLFSENFSVNICTNFSIDYLLNGGKGLVWSKFHLRLVKYLNEFGLAKVIRRIANDEIGIVNKFFTPTFYCILKKK